MSHIEWPDEFRWLRRESSSQSWTFFLEVTKNLWTIKLSPLTERVKIWILIGIKMLLKLLFLHFFSIDTPVKVHICPMQVRVQCGKSNGQLRFRVKRQGWIALKKKKKLCLSAFEVTSSIITRGVNSGHGCWARALHPFSSDPGAAEGLRWSKAFRAWEVVGQTQRY